MNNQMIQSIALYATVFGVLNTNLYSTNNFNDLYEVSTHKKEIISGNEGIKYGVNVNDLYEASTHEKKIISGNEGIKYGVNVIEVMNDNKDLIKNIRPNNNLNNNSINTQNNLAKQNEISINILGDNQNHIENKNEKTDKQNINNPFNLDENEHQIILGITKYLFSKKFIRTDVFDDKFVIINDLRQDLYDFLKYWDFYQDKSERHDIMTCYMRKNLVAEYIKYSSNFIGKLKECKKILCNSVATRIENITLDKINQLRSSDVDNIQTIDNIITELNNIKNSINDKVHLNITQEKNKIIREIDNTITSCENILHPIVVYMTLKDECINKIKNGNIIVSNNKNTETCKEECLKQLQEYKEQCNNILDKIKSVDIMKVMHDHTRTNVQHCKDILNIIEKNRENFDNEFNVLYNTITDLINTQVQLAQNYQDFYQNRENNT